MYELIRYFRIIWLGFIWRISFKWKKQVITLTTRRLQNRDRRFLTTIVLTLNIKDYEERDKVQRLHHRKVDSGH